MIDLLYLAFNRLEFTRKTFETMLKNTDWTHVSRLVIYDDGSTDGTREYLAEQMNHLPVLGVLRDTKQLGPVGIMCDFLQHDGAGIFCKIDNDTMLPPNWLNECLDVMSTQDVDLLGIEAMRPLGDGPREAEPAIFIGGIGLMRRKCFTDLPTAAGRFGFGHWQEKHEEVKKAWLNPALPVCLLNLLSFEPWQSLSAEYIARGWQRDWPARNIEKSHPFCAWWAE